MHKLGSLYGLFRYLENICLYTYLLYIHEHMCTQNSVLYKMLFFMHIHFMYIFLLPHYMMVCVCVCL